MTTHQVTLQEDRLKTVAASLKQSMPYFEDIAMKLEEFQESEKVFIVFCVPYIFSTHFFLYKYSTRSRNLKKS